MVISEFMNMTPNPRIKIKFMNMAAMWRIFTNSRLQMFVLFALFVQSGDTDPFCTFFAL